MVAQPLYMENLAFKGYGEPTSAPAGYMTGYEFERNLKIFVFPLRKNGSFLR